MRITPSRALLVTLGAASLSFTAGNTTKPDYSTHNYYVLEHDPSALSPSDVADALGAELVGQVGELRDHYLIRARKPSEQLGRGEATTKRDSVMDTYHSLQRRASSSKSTRSLEARQIVSATRSITLQVPRQRVKRQLVVPPSHLAPRDEQEDTPAKPSRLDHVREALQIFDPTFDKQWHLLNERTPPHDMNVTGVWEMGYTGKGVISAIVDDGLDFKSDDLAGNYWPQGSWDYNDHVPEPLPRLADDQHGTRCAGEVAAVRNDVCGVGVAYNSKISGIRILSGSISDADEAASLNYGYNETSIYSCSWGPPDDGRSMEAPSEIIKKAVLNGIENGRNGKGSVFVFASGNGAASDDQCNFDGYTNSIYSVTVSAVDSKGQHPYYSEACAANMIVAYSSGGGYNIHTTDVGKQKCTGGHGGTSAAAPLAVGVFALALEARPELTWRDIQHLCVNTARQVSAEDPDWEKIAQGRLYSYKYGFGALDAYRFVTAAKDWPLVKPQTWIEMPQIEFNNANMSWDGKMSGGDFIVPGGLQSSAEITQDHLNKNNFEKLEHVTVKVWINHSRRGDVEVSLVSPNGIKSVLGGRRKYDEDKSGYPGWTFMTLKHWDENPIGKWTVTVSDQASETHNGTFLGWTMTLWGSVVDPNKAIMYSQRPKPADETAGVESSTSTTEAVATSTTKQYTKPTDHLPGDHDSADGESHLPAFPGGNSTNPTPDEGYFTNMSDLLSSQTWLFAALGVIVLLAAGAGAFFWRRKVARRGRGGADYVSLAAGDDVPMGSMDPQSKARLLGGRRSGAGGTKELYDAFGEVSDEEEEYEDEEMALEGAGSSVSPLTGLRYHDEFLEDEDGNSPVNRYRDEPSEEQRAAVARREASASPESASGSGSGSGSGSWEDAEASADTTHHR